MIFDFQRKDYQHQNVRIENSDFEIFQNIKYLGCYLDDKLTFAEQVQYALKIRLMSFLCISVI